MKQMVKRLFKALGLTIAKRDRLAEQVPTSYLRSQILPPIYRQSLMRVLYFKEMIERIRDVDGDIVECGVSIGTGLLYLMLLGELNGVDRKVVGFDSFEQGFPQPADQDKKANGFAEIKEGDYGSPVQLVMRMLQEGRVSQSLIDNKLVLVKGFFEQTLSGYEGRIALLHLDCDLYQSYKTCLERLYDKVARGGIILFDEYEYAGFPGASQAVDEFFQGKQEVLQRYHQYQYTKYYVVKGATSSLPPVQQINAAVLSNTIQVCGVV